MLIGQCFSEGIRNVFRSRRIIAGLYLVNIGLCVPLALAMRAVLEDSIGSSLVQEKLRQGLDLTWYGEFQASNSDFARTFGPNVVGVLPIAGNIEKMLDGTLFKVNSVILLPAVVFLLTWAFFGGGIIGNYARPLEPWSAAVFVGDSVKCFFRFVRLTIMSVALYVGVVRWIAGPLHKWVEAATRDVTTERTAMICTGVVYLVVILLLALLALVIDYAKILLVLERRKSSLLSFIGAVRFVWTNGRATLGLYVALAAVGIAGLAIYGWIAPGATQSSVPALAASFALTQTFVIARIILKLWFLASQTALYRMRQAVEIPRESAPPMHAETLVSEDTVGGV